MVLKDAGYDHRRLKNIYFTGIFECNSLCQCAPTCHNKVSQRPIQVKLQVFKTWKKGWGVRALHDIPEGTFVCKYVGKLYNSHEANIEGEKFGDDYFCELDLIELVERNKDGYESDVTDIEEEDHDKEKEKGDTLTGMAANGTNQDDNCHENENGNTSMNQEEVPADQPPKKKFKSIRKYYSKDDREVFIIDAMKSGNVGRYLNHCCDPNVYVQNIFQETHDLRFPTVAFFTCKFVRAGDELCWNYNYEESVFRYSFCCCLAAVKKNKWRDG